MYSNLSLYFSSDCNMACQYCQINKHKPCMAANNAVIREKMASGEYAQNIIKRFAPLKDTINHISLWGMEPTINADLFRQSVFPLLDEYQNVTSIMFSTNSWLGYGRIWSFIEALDEYNRAHDGRNLKLDLQISLDGPAWINDLSRRKGTTDNTLHTIRELVTRLPHDITVPVYMHTKPTLDVSFMREMVADNSKLLEWYHFFDNLQDEMLKLCDNPQLQLALNQLPTLVNPGMHTQEDGRTLAAFIRALRAIDDSQFKYYKHPLITQVLRGFDDACGVNNHISAMYWGSCSAGRTTANVDVNGELYSCHGLFAYSYMQPDASITRAHTTAKDHNPVRLQYVDLLWSEYPESRRAFAEIIIRSLAESGQIDACYKTDKQMRDLLYYALGGIYCQYGHLEMTQSIWAYCTSQFKYFGNGAMQEVLRYMRDCGMLNERN